MALDPITLKSNTFLGTEDVMDHLRIPTSKQAEYERTVNRLINMVTDMMEKYIEGPILTRSFTEVFDGNNTNVIVPKYGPVRTATELRIDYNGDFAPATSVIPLEYVNVRGGPDLELGIKGSDVVMRNDENTSIIGRLFVGSVIQSVQLKYTAGLGADAASLPEDLKYAALLAIEYFYILRENRELNISSKNNNNQGYSRTQGLPQEVRDILDSYRDYTFGQANRAQKNEFPL